LFINAKGGTYELKPLAKFSFVCLALIILGNKPFISKKNQLFTKRKAQNNDKSPNKY
jgi:hypothetical protein